MSGPVASEEVTVPQGFVFRGTQSPGLGYSAGGWTGPVSFPPMGSAGILDDWAANDGRQTTGGEPAPTEAPPEAQQAGAAQERSVIATGLVVLLVVLVVAAAALGAGR